MTRVAEMGTDDTPITLEEACKLYPQAAFKVATLRAAADQGILDIFRLGRRYHTTPAAMAEWVLKCREKSCRHGSTSTSRAASGLSETDRISSAQVALRATLGKLKSNSRPI